MSEQPLVPESTEVQRERVRRLLRAHGRVTPQDDPVEGRSAAPIAPERSVLRWLLLMPDDLLGADPEKVGRDLGRLLPHDGKSVVDRADNLLEWWDSLLTAYVEGADE